MSLHLAGTLDAAVSVDGQVTLPVAVASYGVIVGVLQLVDELAF